MVVINAKTFHPLIIYTSYRVANRVHAPDGVFFLGLIVGYTVIYSCIYEVAKNLNIVLTRGEDNTIGPRVPDV